MDILIQVSYILCSILRRVLRDVLLNLWAKPLITSTITSLRCRDCTIKSTSLSLSTTIFRRCWSFRNSSTCTIFYFKCLVYKYNLNFLIWLGVKTSNNKQPRGKFWILQTCFSEHVYLVLDFGLGACIVTQTYMKRRCIASTNFSSRERSLGTRLYNLYSFSIDFKVSSLKSSYCRSLQ